MALLFLRTLVMAMGILSPLLYSRLINELMAGNAERMWTYLCTYLGLLFVTILVNHLLRIVELKLSKSINYLAKVDVGTYLFDTPAHRIDFPKGKKYSVLLSDSNTIYACVSTLMSLFFTVLTIIGVGFVTLSMNWKLSLLLLVPYPFEIIINRIFRPKLKARTESLLNQNDKYVSKVANVMDHQEDAQQSDLTGVLKLSLNTEAGLGKKLAILQGKTQNTFQTMISSCGLLGHILLSALGLYFVLIRILTLGEYIAFSSYSKNLSSSIDELINMRTNLQPLFASLDRVVQLRQGHQEYRQEEVKKRELSQKIEKITLRNISFSYDKLPVLKDLSAEFVKGKIYGIVGTNGCGKTTLLRLLTGRLKTAEGEILLGGAAISGIRYGNLLSHISYVDSHKHLYYLPMWQNMFPYPVSAMANGKTDPADYLNIRTIAEQLPEKYDTVFDDSKNLSSGQIQRIQLARAMARNAEVLLLDEAFSNLDKETKEALKEQLQKIAPETIIILVSHLANEMDFCDEIYELAEGRLRHITKPVDRV